MHLIVTQGPYSSFLDDVVQCELVSGIRLNTIMPIKEDRFEEKLSELRDRVAPKTLWIDLKARQLRIREFANTPYTAVTISHRINVRLPNTVYFDNGHITARLADIDGYRLILEDYAGRLLGPGESVNIIDESLEYLEPDLLTERDRRYVEACRKLGIDHYMLSFVEREEDVLTLKRLHPSCTVMSKIESRKGLKHLNPIYRESDYLMAARGDLYTELDYPHEIGNALKTIYAVGKNRSIVASRMLTSLLRHPVPSCPDMMDLLYLKDIGYTAFMIGDDICFKKEILMQSIKIFQVIFNSQ